MADVNEIPPVAQSPQSELDREMNPDARLWAMFCHLAGLAGFVVPIIGFVVGPLVVWLLKKDRYPFVDEQGKEAMNFQLTMIIAGLALAITCIGAVLLPVLLGVDLILAVIAAIKANDGHHHRYPLTIRFVK